MQGLSARQDADMPKCSGNDIACRVNQGSVSRTDSPDQRGNRLEGLIAHPEKPAVQSHQSQCFVDFHMQDGHTYE
jgi:hypothetical protein